MARFSTYHYEDGNAARYLESTHLPTREDLRREQIEQKRQEKRKRLNHHRRKKQASRRLAFFIATSAVVIGLYFVAYVHIQNQITTSMGNISSLEKEITQIKTENAALKSRISTTANLSKIQKTAIKDLGMVYASSSQIVYYSVNDDDFMNQYEEIK